MFECNCQSRALPNNILKPFWYLSVFTLLQSPSIMAGDLTNVTGVAAKPPITVAKVREYNNAKFCEGNPSNFQALLDQVAKEQQTALDAAKLELTEHGIQVNWSRRGAPQNGLTLPACNATQTELLVFEIPQENLEQARALGFKLWSEWPTPIFISNRKEPKLTIWPSPAEWETPPFVVKSSGTLQCDEQGKPKPYFRFDDGLGHPDDMSYTLGLAGIPVDYMFCAIRPDYPPQGVCGQDSGKLDVFKIPESSIPRALALGFQLAGVGVDGGIGAIKPIPCNNLPNADTTPCTAAPELAVNAPATVNTTPATLVYDISLTGNLKDRAKLRTALGKAVT